jgi:RHS repeat-associated protein
VDANGSTTGHVSAGTTTSYVYNGRGRMTSVQVAGATAGTYAYNALDERVAKTTGTTTTRFVYDTGRQLVSEASGATGRDYITVDGLPLAVADGSTLGFITADGLGLPRALTSAAGAVVWTWPYALNPFGENRATSTTGYVLNLRLPGQYADGEAGLKYNINRSFDAATGRYMQSEPIGLAGGASTYGYVGGNPLSYADPLGLDRHHYSVKNYICSVIQPGCTALNVFGRLRQYPAPFSDPSHPIKNGRYRIHSRIGSGGAQR